MSHFLISCGGTGGHLAPGIALAEGLAERGHESVLLISQKKVDARLIEKYPHLTFARVPGVGLSWSPVGVARFAISHLRGFGFCRRLLRTKRTDAVIGFGGFTSAPLVAAARLARVPAVLHEANRVPGRAVRTLGRFAVRVYLPPGVELGSVDVSVRRHVGLPVRREVIALPAADARRVLGLDPNQRVLVVLGGSQGSSPLNDWTRANAETLAKHGIQTYCVTGLGKDQAAGAEYMSDSGAKVRVVFEAFSDRIPVLLSAADLVLSRAGAGTLAELARCEAPAILVPFPQAADDHQRANAAYFEQQGGGVVVPQTELSGLCEKLLALVTNDAALRKMRLHLRAMDRVNALELMVQDIEAIVAKRNHAGAKATPAHA